MFDAHQQQQILQDLQHHIEAGRLGLQDLTEHLAPEELRLLRERPGQDALWPERAFVRLRGLVQLAEARAAGGGCGVEVITVLLVGFAPAERQRLTRMLDASNRCAFRLRSAESLAQAGPLLEQGGFDALVLDLAPAMLSEDARRLALAEVMRSGVPIVPLVDRKRESPSAELAGPTYVVRGELDADRLADALCSAVARSRASDASDSSQEKQHFSATRDALTGLVNRFGFREQLERALRYAERHDQQVAVLYMDIDGFRKINESLGQEVGDSMLITLTQRMESVLRKSDLVSRVGGDEFLVMIQGNELEYAPARTAERLLECLTSSFVVSEEEHGLTASIGIATHPRDGSDPDTLIRHADAAMYQVKAEGRNGYRFYGHSANEVDARRHDVATRLRGALERGDFTVHYQPRVDARDGTITGAEALLRWTDAELGPVSPAEFVPIAERSGLMCEIGAWVMQEACSAHSTWAEAGFEHVCVSVNVSAHQLRSGSLRDAVISAVMGTGLAAGRLEIELTESALVSNQNTAAQLLRELDEIGVTLALDDFGTGHSALSYLRVFPVRTLKIDPTFVREITPDTPAPMFVDAVISLARTLDLDIVAEGVETEQQRDALLERGCNEVQGFLFSPAVSSEALLRLLHAGPLTTRA